MKTSNKISVVLIALALVIPPLLLLAFRIQIKNNNYTSHYSNGQRIIHQPVIPAKYLVVRGMGLECNILHADSSYVDYYQPEQPNNAIKVVSSGDTLFVTLDTTQNIAAPGYGSVYYELRQARVYLPNLQNLTVTNAVANLDTVSRDLYITARNGSCNIARYSLTSSGFTSYGRPPAELDTYSITNAKGETTPLYSHVARLSVDAEESTVYIGSTAMIDTLAIAAQKESTITIKKEAVIKQLKTNLDNSTQVSANTLYMKRLINSL
jgi:hypothetical protein